MTTVVVNGVGKTYGDHLALADVSFVLEPGAVTALVGANGSGKSTLIKRMLGLVSGSGETTFDGQRYAELANPVRTVGVALDAQMLDPTQTPRRYLARVATACGASVDAIDDVLQSLDLAHVGTKRIGQFSLGMRQRLTLAAALLPDPEVLIFDEPGNGMDPAGLHWLRQLVRSRAQSGRTVLLSSHLLSDVEACADRVILVDRGSMRFDGSISDFVSSAGPNRVVVRSDSPDRLAASLRDAGATLVLTGPEQALVVEGLNAHAIASIAVREAFTLHEIRPERRDLNTAYFEAISGATDGSRHRERSQREEWVDHVPA